MKKQILSFLLIITLLLMVPFSAMGEENSSCGNTAFYTFSAASGTLTVSGSGDVTTAPWLSGLTEQIQTVVIEEGITGLPDSAFANCKNLETIRLPGSLNALSYNCFYCCESLNHLTFQEGLTHIEAYAFEGCSALIRLELPESLEYIGYSAFAGCFALAEIKVSENLAFIGGDALKDTLLFKNPALRENGLLYIGSCLADGAEAIGTVTIKEGTLCIAPFAFKNSSITEAILPKSMKTLGYEAFAGSDLSKIILPETLTQIEAGVLLNTPYEKEITHWDGSVLYAGCYAFACDDTLSEISLKSNTKGVAAEAFYEASLTAINFNEGLIFLEESAFEKCTRLKEIVLPSTLQWIEKNCFEDCSNLKTARLPIRVGFIGPGAFRNCSSLTELRIPGGITALYANTLRGCSGLTTLILSKGIKTIGDRFFEGCNSLTDIYYLGTAADWNQISTSFNAGLPKNVTFHFRHWGKIPLKDSSALFQDVAAGKWYTFSIDYAITTGLFRGTSATTFKQEGTMSRAMVVTVLARLSGANINNETDSGFNDVKSGRYYTGAVAWAKEQGIVTGTTETTFRPDDPITRQQFCTMLVRYCAAMKIPLRKLQPKNAFTDEAEISNYAKEAVALCQQAGLIEGMPDGRFSPKGNTTRSQGAKILSLFHQHYIDG